MAAGKVARSRVAADRADRAARGRWLHLHVGGATIERRSGEQQEYQNAQRARESRRTVRVRQEVQHRMFEEERHL